MKPRHSIDIPRDVLDAIVPPGPAALRYRAVSAASKAGDISAIAELQGAAKAMMEEAKAQYLAIVGEA